MGTHWLDDRPILSIEQFFAVSLGSLTTFSLKPLHVGRPDKKHGVEFSLKSLNFSHQI
jgi:hypothetical protein